MGQFTYRARSFVVEAWQNMAQNEADKPAWLQEAEQLGNVVRHHIVPRALAVITVDGTYRADFGDYLVRDAAGDIRVVKPDVFDHQYEPAPDEEADLAIERPIGEKDVYSGPPQMTQQAADEIASRTRAFIKEDAGVEPVLGDRLRTEEPDEE